MRLTLGWGLWEERILTRWCPWLRLAAFVDFPRYVSVVALATRCHIIVPLLSGGGVGRLGIGRLWLFDLLHVVDLVGRRLKW
jgi:hypothetical protein